MNEIINEVYYSVLLSQKNLPTVLTFLAFIYIVFILNKLLGNVLTLLAVYPRKWFGLFGIVCYSFIHQDFNHIFFNSVPLFILAIFVMLNGFTTFVCVTMTVTIFSGALIWLLGRPAYHIGASGLIMGYWSYLLINAYQNTTVISIGLAFVCIYYFGSLLFHLIPQDAKTSWEAHVYGFIGGLAAAYTCPAFCTWMPGTCYQLGQIHIY